MDNDEYACPICSKVFYETFHLRRHIKRKHAGERVNPDNISVSNEKVENLPNKIFKCPKCDFTMPHENFLDAHLDSRHKVRPFQHKCFVCLKPFYSNIDLQNHVKLVHSFNSEDNEFPTLLENTASNSFIFQHPFSMIVAGPSRCGKTYWVINLLLNAERIKPAPEKIVYCYAHWQPKYDVLKKHIDSVVWHEGMPSKLFLDNISNAIVVLDDLMAESVNNSTLMGIFTERSHHQKISVILLMQNLYQQGKGSVSIQRNAQFLVLFKNPRDRSQIKVLAMQMFPEKWRKFLEKFEHETNKPRGKVILDFSSDTSDENRIVKSCDLKDFFQKAQKQQAIVSNPYYAKAIEEKSRINEILNNPTLSNPQKEIEYEQAAGDYSQYMKKAEPIATAVYPLPNQNALARKTSATITRPKQLPFPKGEPRYGTMEDILNLPYEPPKDDVKSEEHLKNILDLPPLSDKDYDDDSGDEDHMKNFIALSDDDETVKRKETQKEYNFRKRVSDKKRLKDARSKKPYEKSL